MVTPYAVAATPPGKGQPKGNCPAGFSFGHFNEGGKFFFAVAWFTNDLPLGYTNMSELVNGCVHPQKKMHSFFCKYAYFLILVAYCSKKELNEFVESLNLVIQVWFR